MAAGTPLRVRLCSVLALALLLAGFAVSSVDSVTLPSLDAAWESEDDRRALIEDDHCANIDSAPHDSDDANECSLSALQRRGQLRSTAEAAIPSSAFPGAAVASTTASRIVTDAAGGRAAAAALDAVDVPDSEQADHLQLVQRSGRRRRSQAPEELSYEWAQRLDAMAELVSTSVADASARAEQLRVDVERANVTLFKRLAIYDAKVQALRRLAPPAPPLAPEEEEEAEDASLTGEEGQEARHAQVAGAAAANVYDAELPPEEALRPLPPAVDGVADFPAVGDTAWLRGSFLQEGAARGLAERDARALEEEHEEEEHEEEAHDTSTGGEEDEEAAAWDEAEGLAEVEDAAAGAEARAAGGATEDTADESSSSADLGAGSSEGRSVSGRRRRRRAALAPRHQQILLLVRSQQYKLTRVWQTVRSVELNMNWMARYLSVNRRLYRSCPVYEQDEAFASVSVVPTPQAPTAETGNPSTAHVPLQEPILDQLWYANNQTVDLARTLGGFERALGALRRRVVVHTTCREAGEDCFEDVECCSGACSFDAKCQEGR